MERSWNDYIPDGSAPDRLKKSLSLAMRRKQYDRVPTEADSPLNLSIEVPQDKTPSLRRSRTNALSPDLEAEHGGEGGFDEELPPTPSVWGRARDAYVNMMVKTTEDASITSVVQAPKTLDRSLTLGSGFGKKVEVPETSLPFKLTKAEQRYLDHLRRSYDGRYA